MSQLSELINLVHVLLCKRKHSWNPEELVNRVEDVCYFYPEENMENPEAQPDHISWGIVVEHLKDKLSFATDEDALTFLVTSLKAIREIREATGGNEEREEFVLSLWKVGK